MEYNRSVRAPLDAKRSRAPLLIAAAVVMIGAGAFFAFKKRGNPSTSGSSVSTSPSLHLTKSPLPTWRKAITRFEDVPAVERAKGTLRWQDGWLGPASTTQSSPLVILPGPKVRNGGIRVQGRMSPDIPSTTLGNVFLRRTPGADSTNQVYRANVIGPPPSNVALTLANDRTKAQEELARLPLQHPLKPGDEYELELIAIGDQFHVRLNDERLPVVTDTRLKEGTMGLHCVHPMRDIEVINLDGLSEAEARKAAGIDDQSQSPALPTSKSPAPAYPQPKQWVDVTANLLGSYVAKGVLRADGEWLEAQKEDFIGIGRGGSALQNLAVRVRFAHQVEVHLRKRAQSLDTFYMLRIGDRKASISLIQGSSPWTPLAAPVELKSDFDDGSEHELVATALGSQLSLWLDGTLLVSATDSTLTGGDLHQIRTKPKAGGPPTRIKQVEYGALEAVSSSPPLPVSLRGSAAKSSAPTWRKVLTKAEDLPLEVRGPGIIEREDGWMDANASGDAPSVRIPGTDGRNQGIRLHGKVTALTGSSIGSVIWLRRVSGPNGKSADYRLFLGAGESPVVAIQHDDRALAQESEPFTFIRPEPALKPGDEYDMELYAIGGKLIARFNGRPLAEVTDTRLTEGYMGIQSKHLIRDVEVINLDDLSEAEARKAAGLDGSPSATTPPAAQP